MPHASHWRCLQPQRWQGLTGGTSLAYLPIHVLTILDTHIFTPTSPMMLFIAGLHVRSLRKHLSFLDILLVNHSTTETPPFISGLSTHAYLLLPVAHSAPNLGIFSLMSLGVNWCPCHNKPTISRPCHNVLFPYFLLYYCCHTFYLLQSVNLHGLGSLNISILFLVGKRLAFTWGVFIFFPSSFLLPFFHLQNKIARAT